jgi:hypothetical protein
MKNKIFGGIAILTIATLAAVNVALSSQSSTSYTISLAKVEALAWEWNNPLDWFEYGLRADERINSTPCSQTTTTISNYNESGSANANANSATGNVSSNINYWSSTQTTTTIDVPSGNRKTCEAGGDENCDPCDCC